MLKQTVYKAIDLATFGKGISRNIGGETLRFPPRFSRYYEADYESETFKFFRSNVDPGNTVLDLGGHIGLFAVVTSRLVGPTGKVFTFEPTPFTRSVLQKVVELNDCTGNVEVRGEAVSSAKGRTTFFDTGDSASNANSLVRTDRSIAEIEVDLISVDEFVAERSLIPNCIKIDVEGAELDVLKGAKHTFLEHRPVARLGLHPPAIEQNGQTLADIWEVLGEYGLEVLFNGAEVKRDWFCTQPELFDVTLIPKN